MKKTAGSIEKIESRQSEIRVTRLFIQWIERVPILFEQIYIYIIEPGFRDK